MFYQEETWRWSRTHWRQRLVVLLEELKEGDCWGEKVWVCLLRLLSPLGAEDGCMDGLMDCQACNTKLKFLMMTHQTLLGVKTLKTVYKTMRSLSF